MRNLTPRIQAGLGLVLALPFIFLTAPIHAAPAQGPTAILVDKKTNRLHVTEYVDGSYRTLKTYHTTTGQVKGDKETEGDLKTPEGIYTVTSRLVPPAIKPKFGVMALYMNYPNPFDQMAGRTGFDIMLHATNEPERLSRNYDSEGCIVVKNEEITEIAPYVRAGLTPVLVFQELTEAYLHPGKDARLRNFFDGWIRAWEGQDIESYTSHYHSEFTNQGRDLAAWKAYKNGLNQRYATIEVKPEKILIYTHPKYSLITFIQNYRSTVKGGTPGHVSRGTKVLYVAEEAGQPKIISEDFTQMIW